MLSRQRAGERPDETGREAVGLVEGNDAHLHAGGKGRSHRAGRVRLQGRAPVRRRGHVHAGRFGPYRRRSESAGREEIPKLDERCAPGAVRGVQNGRRAPRRLLVADVGQMAGRALGRKDRGAQAGRRRVEGPGRRAGYLRAGARRHDERGTRGFAVRRRTRVRMTGVKAASVRDLYVGLLLKSVANLIYGPPPADPWNDVLFKRGSNPQEQIRTPAHTMVGVLRLENLRQLTQRVIDEGVTGGFIETGVWRGGCCILMRGILAANGINDRKVYVADSFQGVPSPKPESYPQDAGMVLHTFPALSVPADVVRANFALYGLLDENVVFVEGFFSETLPAFQGGPFSLIRLDGDLYESNYVALEYF